MTTVTELDQGLTWNIDADGDTAIVRLCGSAGFHQLMELERCVRAIAAQRASLVLLELSQLAFISSVGLGAIVSLKRTIEARSGKMRLAGLNPVVAAIFRIARLNEIFEIV